MYSDIRIAPSILSANFMHMGDDIHAVEDMGADIIHVDVMDGHFVPNLTMGIPFIKNLYGVARRPVDVHLMIDNPLVELPWFVEAGAWNITVHYEAFANPEEEIPQAIAMIHEGGSRACVSLKPDTPVEALRPFLSQLDMVLMMSVYPGFSGQSYIEGTEDRIADLVRMCEEQGCRPDIEVDGGINAKTVARVARAGADVFVMGSACFTAEDPAKAMAEVRSLAQQAAAEALADGDGGAAAGVADAAATSADAASQGEE